MPKLTDYVVFHDKKLAARYADRRIPMSVLYEAYFDGKLDVIGGDESLLDTLYQRHQYARSILTAAHVKFFLLQFIPEFRGVGNVPVVGYRDPSFVASHRKGLCVPNRRITRGRVARVADCHLPWKL